jgi:hypothetical protein
LALAYANALSDTASAAIAAPIQPKGTRAEESPRPATIITPEKITMSPTG